MPCAVTYGLRVQHKLQDISKGDGTCTVTAPKFNFECPIAFFKADDAPEGKQRRIAGIISTESVDQQNERLLQDGLNFAPFMEHGWFNDNHSKGTTDILGYPEKVTQFRRGQTLPDGSVASQNLTWSEGYLLDTQKAGDVWDLGCALQKTGRRLGFSVEGNIEKRTGPDNMTIARATVRNVAVTNCPVNSQTRLEVLARSLAAIEVAENDRISKTMGVGYGPPTPNVPVSGINTQGVTVRESLERKTRDNQKRKKTSKSLTDAQAVQWMKSYMPGLNDDTATMFVHVTKALRRSGLL